jgi:hypothetical protein
MGRQANRYTDKQTDGQTYGKTSKHLSKVNEIEGEKKKRKDGRNARR